MIGIVLWYNTDKCVGLVWCEDQGPLAYIGPDIAMPQDGANLDGANLDGANLGCGDQISFVYEVRENVRYVVAIEKVQQGRTMADPQSILSAYHDKTEARQLRVVA